MNDVVDENAADRAACRLRDVEHLDAGFRRPDGGHIDRQPAHDRPTAIKDHEVEREARIIGRSRVADDDKGAAISALVLETVELDADRRRGFGRLSRRPGQEHLTEDERETYRGGPEPAAAHSTDNPIA